MLLPGREVSPHSWSREVQLPLLTLGVRYLLLAAGCSSAAQPPLQGQKNPSKMVGTGTAVRRYPTSKGKREAPARKQEQRFAFRIKPCSCQSCSEGSNKPCAHQDPGTPQRLRQNCVWASPVEAWVGSALPQGEGLWVWVWHKPSWRWWPLTPL